jgi:putative ABC transport system permease protein
LAQAELDVLAKRLGWDSRPVWASLVDQTRSETAGRHVSIFAAVVAVVFLIVILNLLTLQIARITRRSHDLSIRTALGASTSRLVRPLILEATLLTLLGAVMAWMVAWSVQDLVRVRVPPFLAGLERVTIDVWAFAFAVGLALPIGIVLGLVPVLRASRSNVSLSMHRLATHNSLPHRRLHGAVTLTQTALAVILLVVAALLAHSYGHMLGIDPGFDSRNVRTAEVEMSGAGLTASNYVAISRLLQEIRALPDVEHVAVTDALPLRMRSTVVGVEADTGVAWDFDPRELSRMPVFQPISAGYEHVMAIPLQAGRWIDESDVASGATVAVISEPLANRLWPGRSALGARLRITGAPGPWLTVVGVSRPIRSMHLFHPPSPSVYVPYTSDVLPVATIRRQMTVAARVAAGSPVMLNPVIARWMPDAISTTGSMQSTVEGYLRTPRFQASVLGWLAAVASLLAALGVYSVVAFSAAQRTREFSLRIALGAPASAVVGQMTCQGATPAAIGVIVGLISSLGVTRAFEGYLFGITRMDVSVYAGVLVVGLLLVTIASWIPARRLARVDPMSMLRQE